MKAEDVKIGMVVIPEGSRADRCTVQSLPDEAGDVTCKWIHGGAPIEFHVDDLEPFDLEKDKEIGRQVQAKVDAAKTAFEAAFAALREAQDTADQSGIDFYELSDEKLLDTSELEKVIDENGWSSSSLWC
jgi:hypothetical protein